MLEAIDCANARVIERRQRSCFALEPREPLRIARERRRHYLERDVAPEFGVACEVDLTHPADTKGRPNLISTETRASRQAHARARLYVAGPLRVGFIAWGYNLTRFPTTVT